MADARILLMGRQPDVVGQLGNAAIAAGRTNDVFRQNQLADLFSEQGPGIFAGNTEALNALSRLDPKSALGIASTRQQMTHADERMKLARAASARAAAAAARKLTAAERKAAVEAMDRAIRGAMQAESQDQLDSFLKDVNPDLVGRITMDNRELYAAQGLGTMDALQVASGDDPEFKNVDGVLYRIQGDDVTPVTEPRNRAPLIQFGGGPTETAQAPLPPGSTAGAFGAGDVALNTASDIADSVGLGQLRPEVSEARARIESKNTQAMLTLSATFPGRPSNLTREQINQMLPRPGFMGNDTARQKANEVKDMLIRDIAAAQIAMQNPGLSASQKGELMQYLPAAQDLLIFYDQLAADLSQQSPASESINQSDIDLMNELLGQ